MMIKSVGRLSGFALLLAIAGVATAQTNQIPAKRTDTPEQMQVLLLETGRHYREAKSLKIEREMESTAEAKPYTSSWYKSFSNVAVAPGNRYRREDRSAEVWEIRQSDGTTEWTWFPWRKQYSEQQVGKSSDVSLSPADSGWLGWLKQIDKKLAGGKVQPPEIITANGRQVSCMVIVGPPSVKGLPDPSMQQRTTYWIDRDRKTLAKEQSETHSTVPEHNVDYVYTTTYTTVELDPSLPDTLFEFVPPKGFERIESLASEPVALVGRSAPPLKLKTLDGKDFDLAALAGKPVIVDFWATWCMPCRQSMPQLAKLYEEFKSKGLDLVSVSLDEDPQDAARYVEQHKYPWMQVADPASQSERNWGQAGIPRLVLVGKNGTVLFESEGYDEQEEAKLRSALHKMDPTFPPAESADK